MSLFDITTKGIPDLSNVAEGEYQIQINEVGDPVTKPNAEGHDFSYCKFVCEIVGEPTAKDIYHMVFTPPIIPNPTPSQEKKTKSKTTIIKKFLRGFGFDPEDDFPDGADFVGKTANVILGVKIDEYGTNNFVKSFIEGA